MTLGTAYFLREALFARASIVKPGQLVECREFVNF